MTVWPTIRGYKLEDRDQLIGLLREMQAHLIPLFDRQRPVEQIGGWYVDALLGICREHKGELLVAEEAERLVGYAVVLKAVTSITEIDEVNYTFAEVAELFVTAPQRRKGVGVRLLEACEKVARGAGVRWLRVRVLTHNTRAHDVYQRFGFRDQLVEMEKALTP
jgi:GNAT superfamily N-acetyltransferase